MYSREYYKARCHNAKEDLVCRVKRFRDEHRTLVVALTGVCFLVASIAAGRAVMRVVS